MVYCHFPGYSIANLYSNYIQIILHHGIAFVGFCRGRPAARAMGSLAMSRLDSAAAARFDLSASAMVRLEGGGSVRSGHRGHGEAGGTGPV